MTIAKILVVGAGLGGLTASSCLLKAGFDVEVFEQAPALPEVGAGIQISANAMHVLDDLGLRDAIMAVGVRPAAYVFGLHDTGEELQRFSLATEHERLNGQPYNQLHRADLHDILVTKARSLKPGIIALNKRAVGFTEHETGVELHFSDGSNAKGDLLVGADGLKSVVRARIVGDVPATYTGDGAWRLTVPTDRVRSPHLETVMSVFMGPGGHCVCYYLRGGTLLNFVGCLETAEVSEESWTKKFPWEQLKAAMAIEDAAILTRSLLLAPSVAEALQLYQRNRVDRTARVVEQSSANRQLFHLSSVAAMRAAFAKRSEGADRNAWLYSYNPLTVSLG